MNRDNLITNMIDQIKEAQMKLGYVRETVRLYYPLSSLYAIMGHHAQGQQLLRALEEAFAQGCVLGQLSFALHGDRMEISIPPQGVEYVHFHVEEPAFLAALIALFESNRHCSLGDIRAVFERFSHDYVCEQLAEEAAEYMGFDYVLYFEDTSIDAYYYCVKEEMGHTVYHRFAREDIEDIADLAGKGKVKIE